MIKQIISAFVLGLIGGAIPGPVLAATFTEVMQSGLLKSFRIVFWGMLTETFVATVTLVALASLPLNESIFQGFSIIGAVILLWIAGAVWKMKEIDTEHRVHFSLPQISAMIVANGELWIFWITVCVPKAIFLDTQLPFGMWIFLLLVEIGWLVSTVGVAVAFAGFRNVLSIPRFIPFLFKFFALVFVYSAVSMTYDSVMFFLNR